jgi:hypothetical protein
MYAAKITEMTDDSWPTAFSRDVRVSQIRNEVDDRATAPDRVR